MSTRWYPLYQRGNPQLRVFLPNFWMKLVPPEHKQAENLVTFKCSMEMTKYDIQSYLEKIYKIYPIDVRTRIALGKTKKDLKNNCVIKDDDTKMAYVVLPKSEKFTFPNLFKDKKEKSENEQLEVLKKEYSKFMEPSDVPGASSWFRIH